MQLLVFNPLYIRGDSEVEWFIGHKRHPVAVESDENGFLKESIKLNRATGGQILCLQIAL